MLRMLQMSSFQNAELLSYPFCDLQELRHLFPHVDGLGLRCLSHLRHALCCFSLFCHSLLRHGLRCLSRRCHSHLRHSHLRHSHLRHGLSRRCHSRCHSHPANAEHCPHECASGCQRASPQRASPQRPSLQLQRTSPQLVLWQLRQPQLHEQWPWQWPWQRLDIPISCGALVCEECSTWKQQDSAKSTH